MIDLNRQFSFVPDCGIATLENMARANLDHEGFDHVFFGHSFFVSANEVETGVFTLSGTPIDSQRASIGYLSDPFVAHILETSGLRLYEHFYKSAGELFNACMAELRAGRVAYVPFGPKPSAAFPSASRYQSVALVGATNDGVLTVVNFSQRTVIGKDAMIDGIERAAVACGGRYRGITLEREHSPVVEPVLRASVVRSFSQSLSEWNEEMLQRFLLRLRQTLSREPKVVVEMPRLWTVVNQRRQALRFLEWASVSKHDEVFLSVLETFKAWQSAWFMVTYYESKKLPPNQLKLTGAFEAAVAAELLVKSRVDRAAALVGS